MQYKIIGSTLGALLIFLGGMMCIPAILDFSHHDGNGYVFFLSALMVTFLGTLLLLMNRGFKKSLNTRQTFLLTTLSWLVMSLAAALPLYLCNLHLSFTDAFFESVSGITTTGSTVLSGLDDMSQGILMWRALIQWIGGIGVIAFAIVFLPFLRIGGMQLFQAESSDRSDKIMPRSADILTSLLLVYLFLTAACALIYGILGMTPFDAVAHALTTIPTGGYSTHDQSFGYFASPGLEWAASFFMLLGGLPFVLYLRVVVQRRFDFFRDDQSRVFLGLLAVVIGGLSLWLRYNSDMLPLDGLRTVTFNIISIITTTGYATTDYTLWGPFAVGVFFILTYIGACAGSTAGGIKMMRFNVLASSLKVQLDKLLYPNGVFQAKYQGRTVTQNDVKDVMGFLCVYVTGNVLLAIGLSLFHIDFITAISAAATAIANVGPGIGHLIGPAGNFALLPDGAKWLLCAGMLLGRLEFLTILVLFSRTFWEY